MQDIHLQICDGGGDRRLRPHHDDHSDLHGLKCPRCESVNTKFCYYNNYNLSQPRYFCKGCRRYWTKGGVLRNVPVGGGCRKAKRSKTKSSQSAEPFGAVQLPRKRKSRSNSSSDSSTTAATASTATAAESLSAMNTNSSFDDGIFSEIGSFASLMASSGHQSLFAFNGGLDPANHCHQQLKFEAEMNLEQGAKLPQPEIPTTEGRFPEQNLFEVDLPLPLRPSTNGGFGPLDWQPNADQGLFDFPNAVDQAYWPSQSSQWTDVDQPSSLYLP